LVLVARVSRDEVEQDADPELARGRYQRIEVLDRPQFRMDAEIVRDVVAPVPVRRRKGRVDPDPSTPSQWRYSRRARRPARSPIPSPFESAKDLGYA
jgi:hypothetical protein